MATCPPRNAVKPNAMLGTRAWTNFRRACALGRAGGIYAVEVYADHVRVVFDKTIAQNNLARKIPSDTKGNKSAPMGPKAGAAANANAQSHQREPGRAPNSAKRRSARRREDYVRKKFGVQLHVPSAPATAATTAPDEPKRADDGARAETAMDVERPSSPRREQEAHLQQACDTLAWRQQQRQPPGESSGKGRGAAGRGNDASPRGRSHRLDGRREGRGLGPLSPDRS